MIHFFGHSLLQRSRGVGDPLTFMTLLENRFDICPVEDNLTDNIVVCSEERILYFLKKTKNIDCAVIFHSNPVFYFNPFMDRDHWKNSNSTEELEKDFRLFNFYPASNKDKWSGKRLSELKISPKLAVQPILTYEEFYHSPDLAKNRFEGALVLIDMYCKAQKIPVIHCPMKEFIPSWFQFSSGIVDYSIQEYAKHNHPHYVGRISPDSNTTLDGRKKTNNTVSEEGNREIADKLGAYIDQLLN